MPVAAVDRSVDSYFADEFRSLVPSPNGTYWFHNMPLPGGDRIAGANPDRAREQKLWRVAVDRAGISVRGKRVLDIGANDGLFTIAALLSGADHVTAINPPDLMTNSFPQNIRYAADTWDVRPEVVAGDFMAAPLPAGGYDVILFFGVLYHLENVFEGVRKLRHLLAPGGVVCVETQVTTIPHPRPIFEMASDSTATTVPQFKEFVNTCGNSNWLLPNDAALVSMADTFGFDVTFPAPAGNEYERSPGLEYRRVCHFRPRG